MILYESAREKGIVYVCVDEGQRERNRSEDSRV